MGAAEDGVYLLWIEGIDPERLQQLAAVATLAAGGVDARLAPLGLAEKTTGYYQMLTGIGAGKLGRFDAVRPVAYTAQDVSGEPEGARQRRLSDLLGAAGATTALVEADAAVAAMARNLLDRVTGDCVIVRLHNAENASDTALDGIVRQCAERAGTTGHTIILTDLWTPPPLRLVNVNNFLAEAGLLERQPGSHPNGEIVWPETLAYGLGVGQIWINMRGREPQGIVAPGHEYNDVRAALCDALRNTWRDPETDAPVVAQALTKEEAYSGEYLFKAPDLVVTYCPGYAASPRAVALELDDASIQPGGQEHPGADTSGGEPYARLIGCGPAFAANGTASGCLVDVVPSILYLLGRPIPPHLDGQVITELFSRAYREQTPILHGADDTAALSEEEEGVIVGRLQALGYLG